MRKKRRRDNKTRSDLSVKKRRTTAKKKAIAKRKSKAPKTRNAGKWSESEYYQRIRQSLRKAFRFWEPMQIALKKASRPSQSANKRIKTEYQCNECQAWFKRADVQIDHIEECGSLNKLEDIPTFIARLTKEETEAFQILCKPCHTGKTKKYLATKKK